MQGWEPADLDELRAALAAGDLVEGTHVEFKALVGAGEGARKEYARDVAALAVHGGRIYIGVAEAEDDDGRPVVAPVELDGLAERLEQVVHARVDPTLITDTRPLWDGDTGRGVLIVRVPLSPRAPHMVDGRYWRRLHTTKAAMSDVEVRDLIAARRRTLVPEIDDALDEWAAAHPPVAGLGRMLLVAHPVHGGDDLLQRVWDAQPAGGGQRWAHTAVTEILGIDVSTGRVVDGWASEDRRGLAGGEPWTTVEVGEDGRLRIAVVNATAPKGSPGTPAGDVLVLSPGRLVRLVARTILLARHVALAASYTGAWDVGLLIDGIDHAEVYDRDPPTGTRFPGDSYRRSARLAGPTVTRAPLDAVTTLCGRFLRAARTDPPDLTALLPRDLRPTTT